VDYYLNYSVNKGETMAVYNSYSDLVGKELQYDDNVVFMVNEIPITHKVKSSYLQPNKGSFDMIFSKLKIQDKNKFAYDAYGYTLSGGCFPSSNEGDFEALTKIALALFKLCDNYKIKNWKDKIENGT
jgi:hypothetical protein